MYDGTFKQSCREQMPCAWPLTPPGHSIESTSAWKCGCRGLLRAPLCIVSRPSVPHVCVCAEVFVRLSDHDAVGCCCRAPTCNLAEALPPSVSATSGTFWSKQRMQRPLNVASF